MSKPNEENLGLDWLEKMVERCKGQACWSAAGAKVGLLHRFIVSLFAATN
jgi:hypothetical protein